jgi:hypothetical protein
MQRTLIKTLVAGISGGVGSVVFVIMLLLFGDILSNVFSAETASLSLIGAFLTLVTVFLATTASNLLATWLINLVSEKKTANLSTVMYQIFGLNLLLFVIMLPIYALIQIESQTMIRFGINFHMTVSLLGSALIYQFYSRPKDGLVSIFSGMFAICLLFLTHLLLSSVNIASELLVFILLPLLWSVLVLSQGFFSAVYQGIASIYDKEFLSLDIKFGEDYGRPSSDESSEEEKNSDKDGKDFLKNQG